MSDSADGHPGLGRLDRNVLLLSRLTLLIRATFGDPILIEEVIVSLGILESITTHHPDGIKIKVVKRIMFTLLIGLHRSKELGESIGCHIFGSDAVGGECVQESLGGMWRQRHFSQDAVIVIYVVGGDICFTLHYGRKK